MKNSKEVQNTRQTVCLDDHEKEVIAKMVMKEILVVGEMYIIIGCRENF